MYSDEQILEKASLLLEQLEQNKPLVGESVLREITEPEYVAIQDVLEDMQGEDIAFNQLFDGKTRVVIDFPTMDVESELGLFVDFFAKQDYEVQWDKGIVSAVRRVIERDANLLDIDQISKEKKFQMKIGKLFAKIADLTAKQTVLFDKLQGWAKENFKFQSAVPDDPGKVTGRLKDDALSAEEIEAFDRIYDQLSLYIPNPGYLDVKYRNREEWARRNAKYWQENAGYIKKNIQNLQNDQYSIIITRDPVDILRMSDYRSWSSCHSPPSRGGGQQSLYKCAVAEAQGHGAVAYVVKTEDLLYATNTANIESAEQEIQEGEIFSDETRGSHIGIDSDFQPISRVRLRQMRYFDWEKHDEGKDDGTQIAVPEMRVYGAGIPGFVNRVVQWARENQEEVISNMPRSGGKVDLDDFRIFGGSSEDTSRKLLLMQLTNLSEDDFVGRIEQDTETEDNLPEDWMGDIGRIWEDQCQEIKDDWNQRYAATEVDFRIEEDYEGGFYITGFARTILEWNLDDWNQLPNSYPMGMHVADEINEYYGSILETDTAFINKKDNNMVRWGCDVNLNHPDIGIEGSIFFDPDGFNEMCSKIDTAIDDKRNAFEEIAERFFKREGVMSGGVYMDLARKIENGDIGSYEWDVQYDGDYEESYESWAMIEYYFDPEALGIEPRILFDLVDRREFALLLRGYLTGPAREDTGSEYWLSIRDKSAIDVGGTIRYQIAFKVDSDSPDSAVEQFYELVTGEMDDEDEIAKAFLGALREEAIKNGVKLTSAGTEKERNWDNLNDLGENKKYDSNYWVKRWKMNF
jgi:hypothetical protein